MNHFCPGICSPGCILRNMAIKNIPRDLLRDIYKTWTLLHLYPKRYRECIAGKPVQKNKIVFLEVRMKELTDSFTTIYQALKDDPQWDIQCIFLWEGLADRITVRKRCLQAITALADARYIFVNDSSYLLGCLPLRQETTVIQLWHACGAFKRFGYSLAGKKFGSEKRELDRYPMYRNFSYVTVSSPEVRWAYADAFQLPLERIVATGVARTDLFYDQNRIRAARQKLETLLPECFANERKRTIVLYAPTFRGRVAYATSPDVLDFQKLKELLGEEYLFLCKHHPFVKNPPAIPESLSDFARDVTHLMEIDELLMISDVCISDYSSLIFEYSLFSRPMIFLAHDLEDYGDWRGFYYSYAEMTPGPVVRTTEETAACLKQLATSFDPEQVRSFRDRFMQSCDGRATQRILSLLKE